ncbi:alpha/beta hydrolase [Dactylosporangium sp. CA-092794]|uniref:alpha/beta hydrolase n=1 Tax=Dactylosporangium sp. CA-092794 TaxID=3239929 RepID=UPI003D8AD144
MSLSVRHDDEIGPPVPFDPELVDALSGIAAGNLPESLTDQDLSLNGAYTVSERLVLGPPGAPPVSLLICRPTGASSAVPALYFMHGGGMVRGTNRGQGAGEAHAAAAELGMLFVSVEYRLAPEHRHPAPVDDCYAGLTWTAEHAEELGIDPDRIVVGGGSVGGGLAAAVALLARDRRGPRLAGQMLLCPMLDDRNDSYSARQMDGHGVWDRTANQMGWRALLGDAQGTPDVSPYAAPARNADWSDLPPAFIDVGSAETFRDEAVDYASRIWRAGGSAELHVWPGGFHGFGYLAPDAAISRTARAAMVPWLRRVVRR